MFLGCSVLPARTAISPVRIPDSPATRRLVLPRIAQNLEAETFFRPRVAGPLPAPRFTATSVLWNSYVIVHGGYSTQASSALGDMHLLDLAPALGRPLGALRQARGEAQRRGWPPVTDQQAVAARGAERDERILFRLMIDAVHDDDDLDDRNLDEEMEE
jgi:hypothetical protein